MPQVIPHQRLADGGPLYFETDLTQIIAEPWNMVSAALFVLLAAYWAPRVYRKDTPNPFLRWAVPILFIGGVGGTIYHGFRIWSFALYMDWVPILLLCLAASIYFLFVLFRKWWAPLLVAAVLLSLQFMAYNYVPVGWATNFSYFTMALLVLGPVMLVLLRTGFYKIQLVTAAFIAFGAALFFRIVDVYGWLPMGTHFLWHTGGLLSAHFMFLYLEAVARFLPVLRSNRAQL